MKIFIISVVLCCSSLFSTSLSKQQIKNLKEAKQVAKLVKAKDGMTFENAIQGIMLVESSAGLELIGDKYKNGKLKSLYESSLGTLQIKISTAKETIKKSKFLRKYFKHLLTDDKKLVNMLLTNIRFSTLIAVYYLKFNYEHAIRLGFSKPYFRTISRYNGGWNNKTYYTRVKKRIRWLKKFKI